MIDLELKKDGSHCASVVICSVTRRSTRKVLYTEDMVIVQNDHEQFKNYYGSATLDEYMFHHDFVRATRMIPLLDRNGVAYTTTHRELLDKLKEIKDDWYCESVNADMISNVKAPAIMEFVEKHRPKRQSSTIFTANGIIVFKTPHTWMNP